jgi:3-oxoacyl-[acyl-carrier protein] reductase
MAIDTRGQAVTVMGVGPGKVLIGGGCDASDSVEWNDESRYAHLAPAGRRGLPEDIAAVVSFLASAEAEFMNGQVVTADGGFSQCLLDDTDAY